LRIVYNPIIIIFFEATRSELNLRRPINSILYKKMMSITHFNTENKPAELKILNKREVAVTPHPLKDHLCKKHDAPLSISVYSLSLRWSALERLIPVLKNSYSLLPSINNRPSVVEHAITDPDLEQLIN
jgi:hypothetical protein